MGDDEVSEVGPLLGHRAYVGCLQIASTYDWRLSIANMERRDNYFSRLQDQIELLHKLKKEKVQPPGALTSPLHISGNTPSLPRPCRCASFFWVVGYLLLTLIPNPNPKP